MKSEQFLRFSLNANPLLLVGQILFTVARTAAYSLEECVKANLPRKTIIGH